jgi:acetyl-CoA synthetase
MWSGSTSSDPQADAWRELVRRLHRGEALPFEEQWATFERLDGERPDHLGPLPAWWPDRARLEASNLGSLIGDLGFDSYRQLHQWSVDHRESFWGAAIDRLGITMATAPDRVLDDRGGPRAPRWLPGAELNIVDSCFKAPGDATAAVLGREGASAVDTVTYGELEHLVNRVAAGLAAAGFGVGDRIALYMPMTLECVAAYLGIIRAGCAAVSVADSFAAHEVERRLRIADASGAITVASFIRAGKHIGLYEKLVEAGAPRTVVVPGVEPVELRDGDLPWDDLLGDGGPIQSRIATPDALINVLFSSGTTGEPKAIPWTHLTAIKAATDGHFHQDLVPGTVAAWPTNIGWMMGPWLIFAALVNGAAMALYDGVPTGVGFADFTERAGVTMLGVVPSLVRSWRASGAAEAADWSSIQLFSSTGEPSTRSDYLWLMSRAGYRAPVIEYCGGTEIGGGYITGTVAQPASPATFTSPALGLDLVVLDESGREVAEGEAGEVFLVPPSIGLSQTLLNRDHDRVYHDGCPEGPRGEVLRRHGDQLQRLPAGFFRAHGRADDTMNLGGIKVSSVEIETTIARHPAVSECAAVAIQPGGEGADALVVYAVLDEPEPPVGLRSELERLIAAELNPLFKIHDVVVTDALPRTASNKLVRRSLRADYLVRSRSGDGGAPNRR